jgi:penicillin amidase
MGRVLRIALRLLVVLLGVVLAAAGISAALLWRTLPGASETAAIPGLSAPVKIGFDSDGIPRIRAATALDGAAALGFVHARDRMFQMELMRRNAAGRLSEIAGPAALPLDRQMRVFGLARAAEADYATLPPDARAMLEAYTRGVNAWIAAHGRFGAPEFLLLGPPEPWRPSDSLLWAKTMGLWLSANWRTELSRLSLAGRLPPDRIGQLWPPSGDPGHPEANAAPDRRYAAAAARLLSVLPEFPQPFTQPSSASNEWAVDGTHSASGAPLLAGDPHLAFGFPGLWYLARIDTPDGTLAGATAPGVPFMVLGRNAHVAWTFTTTGADVQDVFVETPTPGGYATPDGPRPFTTREERIKVRGQADEVLTVRETRHGPVISDLDPRPGASPGGASVLAVAMANLKPGDIAAAGLLALNQAKTVAQAGQAAAMITSPVQNLLVADHQGIGLFVTGRVPIRRAGDGSAPVPGASGDYDWIGFSGGDALPRYVAPASGHLVNANERIAPPDFPVFLGRDWFGDWRAVRIRQLLGLGSAHEVEDFSRMQTDIASVYAVRLLPRLRALPPPAGLPGRALALLAGWDGRMAMDAPQPLIFNAWIEEFDRLVLERAGVPPGAAGPTREFVAYVLSAQGEAWCGGDCNALLAQALTEATASLAARYGDDLAAWRWGTAHRAVFAHPLISRLPLVGRFGIFSIPAPGDDTTVDRGGTGWSGFDAVHGASFRAAYDLADLDRSRFVMAPGQSGNPFSADASNFLVRWRDGDTISLGPEADRVTASITLTPTGTP